MLRSPDLFLRRSGLTEQRRIVLYDCSRTIFANAAKREVELSCIRRSCPISSGDQLFNPKLLQPPHRLHVWSKQKQISEQTRIRNWPVFQHTSQALDVFSNV